MVRGDSDDRRFWRVDQTGLSVVTNRLLVLFLLLAGFAFFLAFIAAARIIEVL